MENAKQEFETIVRDKIVKCAIIYYTPWDQKTTISLSLDWSANDYLEFLSKLDFSYDDGYGSQELFGNIWFTDGTWAERYEYDGSEYWEIKQCPKIPTELNSKRR